MSDHLSKEKRKWNMSRVRSEDTRPEYIVRSLLHRAGFRFSLRRDDLIGKPDIVLPKYNAVIFVHGCFWHRHKGCKRASTPKANREKWIKKFERNIERDKLVKDSLHNEGWNVITVWECEVKKSPNEVLNQILDQLGVGLKDKVQYSDKHEILKIADSKFRTKFKKNDA